MRYSYNILMGYECYTVGIFEYGFGS